MICTIRDVDCCAHKKSFNTAIPVKRRGEEFIGGGGNRIGPVPFVT